jgi:NADPH:quinone reductase-like Zn-dependent oxidoreductase
MARGRRSVQRASLLSWLGSQKLRGMLAKVRTEDLRFLQDLIEEGSLRPVIDRSYALSEAAEAVRYLSQGHARGKVVVTI